MTAPVVLEQSQRPDGVLMQTVRLPDGSEVVREVTGLEALALMLATERMDAEERAHDECGTTSYDGTIEDFLPEAWEFIRCCVEECAKAAHYNAPYVWDDEDKVCEAAANRIRALVPEA